MEHSKNQPRCYVTAPGIDIGLINNRAFLHSGMPCCIILPENRTVMRKGTELSLFEPRIPPEPWRNNIQDVRGQLVTIGNQIHAVQGQYANMKGIVCGLTRNCAFVKKEVSTGNGEIVPVRVTDTFRCDTKPVPASILRGKTIVRKTGCVFLMDPIPEQN